MKLPSNIRTRLDQLRSRMRAGEALRGSGRIIALSMAGLLAWFLLDYWLVVTLLEGGWWDLSARCALNVGLVWLISREAARGLISEFLHQRSDDSLAMRLETCQPELAGQLISVVQLTRDVATGHAERVGSLALVEALVDEVRQQAGAIDHRRAWDLKPALQMAALGVIMLTVMIGLAIWKPGIAQAFAHRIVLLSTRYPTATRLIAVHVPEFVGQGDAITVDLELDPTSDVPASAEAMIRGQDDRTSILRLERVTSAATVRFRGVIKNAIDDIVVRPQAGDDRWPSWVSVKVLPRPAVKNLNLRVIAPAYLNVPETPSQVGDLQVPAGSEIVVSATLSRPVKEASLECAVGTGTATVIPLKIAADGLTVDGRFVAAENGWWSISLRCADGIATIAPPHWTIIAIPDIAPIIQATYPARDKDATQFARWPVRFTVRDDHAVRNVRLRWLVVPAGADPEAVIDQPTDQDVPGMITQGSEVREGETVIEFTPLNLEPGMRVVWWLEATDMCTPQPNLGVSQRGTFTILEPSELRERMLKNQIDLLTGIKGVSERQRASHDAIDSVRKAGEAKKP